MPPVSAKPDDSCKIFAHAHDYDHDHDYDYDYDYDHRLTTKQGGETGE